jgi:hypothetical protein
MNGVYNLPSQYDGQYMLKVDFILKQKRIRGGRFECTGSTYISIGHISCIEVFVIKRTT